MSKSLMIINTPKSCEECNLCVAVLGKHYCAAKGTHIAKGERDCSCPLVAVPTVEAVPVVHGEWINEYINPYGHPCHICSVCGFHASYKDKNFCPNCGVDMRKKV